MSPHDKVLYYLARLAQGSGTGGGTGGTGSGNQSVLQFTAGHGATASSATSIGSGQVAMRASVFIVASYSAGTTFALGATGATTLLIAGGGVDLTQAPGTVYDFDPLNVSWPTTEPVLASFAGAPSVGSCAIRGYLRDSQPVIQPAAFPEIQ